nr:hypothetical protein [Tanacetum cinerariifolium]
MLFTMREAYVDRDPKMVLRVKKKLSVIEQPISPAPPTNSEYLRSEVRYMMLIMSWLVLCSEDVGKPVGPYVIKMKNYAVQLERLGYVLPRDLSFGLFMNGLTSDFAGFVRNYNKHNMGKTIDELHALLIDYENGKGKGKGKGNDKSYILKPENPKRSAKEHPIKDDTYHHYKEVGHCKMKCPTYLAELIKKKNNGIYEIDMINLVPNVNTIYNYSYFITFTDDYSCYGYIYLLKHKHEVFETFKVFKNEVKNQLGKTLKDYALESATRILNMVPNKKVDKTPYELWYAELFEKNIISQEVSERAVELEEIQDEDTSPSENTREIPMEVEGFEPPQEEVIHVRSYKAAMLDPKSDKWLDAINAKMQSMKDNQVWCLVDLPPNAKCFTQTYGVDYEETFSPFADVRAIRILIAITAFYVYEIWQMDVKTAFLNGYLDEDIYMVQAEGFVDPKHLRKVCKLQRSIYSLKQASRSWNKRFDEEIKKFGFAQNLNEPYVYQKASGSNVTFLILYIDDIIIMENHILSLQSVKSYLGKCFAMKDLGKVAFILGIKIYIDRSKRLIRLSQSAYMDKILKRYRMDISKRGYIFILNGGAVDWKSFKQSTTAMSATEAEYIATSEAALGAVWIMKFISGLGIVPIINEPIKMFCDNSAALLIANEPGVQRGAR